MIKIINYIKFNLSSKKILFICSCFLLFIFCNFWEITRNNQSYNYYDIVINQLNYLNIFFFTTIFFVLILYNIYNDQNFNTYLHLKFKSKLEIYNINIITIVIIAALFIFFLNSVILLLSIGNLSFKNEFSPYFFHYMTGNMNLFYGTDNVILMAEKYSPILYILLINMYVFLYLVTVGCIFITSKIILRKESLAFIVIIFFILSNILLELPEYIQKISFKYNIFFITASYSELQSNFFIIVRLIYWIILISILYCIGNIFTKKYNYLTTSK